MKAISHLLSYSKAQANNLLLLIVSIKLEEMQRSSMSFDM